MKLSPALQPFAPAHNGYKFAIDSGGPKIKNKNHPRISIASRFMRSPSDKPGKSSGTGHTGRRGESRPKQKSAAGAKTEKPIAVQTPRRPDAANTAAEGAPRAATLPDSALEARVIFRAVRDARGRVGDFLIAEANEAACTYNRLSHEQLVGRSLLEIFPNSKTSGLFDMYVRILESGETLELADFSYLHEIHRETRRFDIPRRPAMGWANHPMDPSRGKAFTHTRNK